MWSVKVRERYDNGGIKWYCLYWVGQDPVSYLSDGRRMGSYRYKRDATKRALELNRRD